MHIKLVQLIWDQAQTPLVWLTGGLSGLVGSVVGFIQSSSTGSMSPLWMGIISTLIGGFIGISLKLIDIWNERHKEKRKKLDAAEVMSVSETAQEFLETSTLRQEERDYFNSLIRFVNEQKRIASLRGHALAGEVDRLRSVIVHAMMSGGGKLPPDVNVFDPELQKYLGDLEQIPMPEISPRPRSLQQDIHRASAPDLRME